MKVVKNKTTGRLVYREEPDFANGLGIANAVILDLGTPADLIEITTTKAAWQNELVLRAKEEPPTLDEQLAALADRVDALEQNLSGR